jgi:hypothetical protein
MFSHMVVPSTEVHDKNKNRKGTQPCQNSFSFFETSSSILPTYHISVHFAHYLCARTIYHLYFLWAFTCFNFLLFFEPNKGFNSIYLTDAFRITVGP